MTEIIIFSLLPMIGSLFILYAIFYSMGQIGTNIIVGRFKRILLILLYSAVTLAFSTLQNGVINLFLMLLIPVIGHYLYNNLRLYIIYYIILVVAVYLTDIMAVFAIQIIYNSGVIYFTDSRALYITFVVAVRFIEFMVLKLLVWIIRRRYQERITRRQMISAFIMPLFSIINLFSMMFFMQIYMSEENMLLFTVNLLMLIGLNIYFTVVFEVISRNNYLKNELNLYMQQQDIQMRYYEDMEKKYDSTRKLVHDVRNHIQMMQHLYEEQNNEAGCQYTKDVHEMLNKLGHKYYTSNKMLNIILNDKVQQMHEHGISEDIMVTDTELDLVRNVDLTTIFANILDNAIEAAELSNEKQIILRVAKIHDFITITLKNSMDKEPVKKADSFESTKKNHEGLGLKNVERVVENYKGDIQYEWKDQYFITRIMLNA
jgi:signal transduction histidine kinase